MNLKFLNDIYKTYIDMKTSIYILGIIACIQTVTFTCYLTYKYIHTTSDKEITKSYKEDNKIDNLNVNENEEMNENEVLTNDLNVNENEEMNENEETNENKVLTDNLNRNETGVLTEVLNEVLNRNENEVLNKVLTEVLADDLNRNETGVLTEVLNEVLNGDMNNVDNSKFVQMISLEEVNLYNNKIQGVYNMLGDKRKELIFIINELNKMQDDIGDLRLKLDEINSKKN